MPVFLAGATGELGRRIIPLLAGRGHHVTAVVRRSDAVDEVRAMGADPALADALDRAALLAATTTRPRDTNGCRCSAKPSALTPRAEPARIGSHGPRAPTTPAPGSWAGGLATRPDSSDSRPA
jgi:NAD(P)-dependent dehydrogenase (short-subunit alcohol dehydrogenase family)